MAELTVLITGSAGFIGQRLVQLFADEYPQVRVIATARRKPALPALDEDNKIQFETLDVRDAGASKLLSREQVDVVIHLASVVTPGPGMSRETMYDIDVNGTKNMLDASLAAGVSQFIVTTSAASYGYHPDNPVPLRETDALRGNKEFAYSDHKRIIEGLLANYREQHPELRQLVFRPGFILGPGCDNQITALFDKPVISGLRGTDTPFTIIWDEDVARCLAIGAVEGKTGIYNQTGDGIVTLREIARMLDKRFIALPPALVKSVLWITYTLGRSQYGPEQIKFLQYRPVLSNEALKKDFGYTPSRSSMECFVEYARGKGILRHPPGA